MVALFGLVPLHRVTCWVDEQEPEGRASFDEGPQSFVGVLLAQQVQRQTYCINRLSLVEQRGRRVVVSEVGASGVDGREV